MSVDIISRLRVTDAEQEMRRATRIYGEARNYQQRLEAAVRLASAADSLARAVQACPDHGTERPSHD